MNIVIALFQDFLKRERWQENRRFSCKEVVGEPSVLLPRKKTADIMQP
jgi:hypothetical protein